MTGDLDQNHRDLGRAGLFFPGKHYSHLCGPTCFINVLHAIRDVLGLPQKQAPGELMYLAKRIGPSLGLSKNQIRKNGVAAYELSAIAQNYLDQLGIRARVTVRGVEVSAATQVASGKSKRTSISLDDLRSTNKRFVIVNYEGWRPKDLDQIEATNPATGWLGGHYVISERLLQNVGGTAAIHVHDPSGAYRESLEVQPYDSKGLGIQTLQVKFPPRKGKPRDSTILDLITNIVIIEIL